MNSANEKNFPLLTCVREALESPLPQTPRRVDPTVAVVITVEDDLTYFPQTFSAVLKQSVLPAVLIVADVGAHEEQVRRFTLSIPGVPRKDGLSSSQSMEIQIVPALGAVSFGDAVSKGVAAGSLRSTTAYLWLFHDDSRPLEASALETLLETDRNSPGARVVGTKQVDWEAQSLHDVGYFLSKNRRRASLVVDGEEDQDQYDDREDVYGVSLAGALVSLQTWMNLSGTDPWYGTFGESTDFGRRVYLSGGRVIVDPKVVVAHRRARFCGVRDIQDGTALEEGETPKNSYATVVASRDRFAASELAVWKQPFSWLWSVVRAIGVFVAYLFAKKPYEAVCELVAPWRGLIHFPQLVAARSRLRSLPTSERDRFASLTVSTARMRDWKQRIEAHSAEGTAVLLSPLAQQHLRTLAQRRRRWVALLVLAGLALGVSMYWSLLGGIFSGSSIYSALLAPTAASLSTVAKSATTMWSFSYQLGAPAAPMPFNLVLLVLSAITGGHLATGIGIFTLLSPALMMVTFWALAGVFTRSNPLRFAMALLWGVIPGFCGIYQNAHLPMLVVFVFLPLSFYLVFRAVGMYAVDEPRRARSSIQASAIAGLSMSFVALSEPQLILPFFVVFAVFLIMVRRHRAMLLLMPLPSIIVLMPTFFSVLIHFSEGWWRQLFVDSTVVDQTFQGSPGNNALFTRIADIVSSQLTAFSMSGSWQVIAMGVLLIVLAVLVAAGIVSLFVPSALRLSRMAWIILAAGGVLGMVSPRIAIGLDSNVPVASSVLPAMAFMAVGLLLAACAMTGRGNSHFLDTSRGTVAADAGAGAGTDATDTTVSGSESGTRSESAVHLHTGLMGFLHSALCVVVLVGIAAGMSVGAANWNENSTVAVANASAFPIIAEDDLASREGARIFALSSSDAASVNYTVMRTSTGDLVDANATTQIQGMLSDDPQEDQLQQIAARLLASNDDEAVSDLATLGFVGIYVPGSDVSSRANLVAHITASEGTEQVVNNDKGLYVRLTTIGEASSQSIDITGEKESYGDPLRKLWITLVCLIVVIYLIVAIPRTRHLGQEEA